MTTNKPEVVAYIDMLRGQDRRYASLRGDIDQYSLNDGDELIRLSDYEALQADRDQQYGMKVKARKQRDDVTTKLSALYAECEKLRKDAERYRFLCDPVGANEDYVAHAVNTLNLWADKTEIDQAIDAAMQEASHD